MDSWAAFDEEALAWIAGRVDPSLELERAWTPPSWSDAVAGLQGVFGLARGSHFLRHHRGLMPRLWEPQITRALRAMLLEVPQLTLIRCQALLDALMGREAPRLKSVDAVTADALDRMDLAIHARTVDGVPCCIVIEAKLESPLSETQLRKYLQGVAPRYPAPQQRHLWVVAPVQSEHTAQVLSRRENGEWHFMTWRRLLLNWQRALPEDSGPDALSLFGEIWKRVGGR